MGFYEKIYIELCQREISGTSKRLKNLRRNLGKVKEEYGKHYGVWGHSIAAEMGYYETASKRIDRMGVSGEGIEEIIFAEPVLRVRKLERKMGLLNLQIEELGGKYDFFLGSLLSVDRGQRIFPFLAVDRGQGILPFLEDD